MWNRNLVKRIDLEITSFCNIACPTCTRASASVSNVLDKKTLSFDLLKEKVRPHEFPNLEIINLCGTVDEPISHPEIDKIVDHFTQWDNIRLSISTNGSIRSTKWWSELGAKSKKTGRISIIWGVDGIDEVSEVYRNGSNFQKVRENWRAYNNAGGRSTWQFIVFEHNKHQLPLLEDIAKEEGFARTKVIYSDRPIASNSIKIVRKNERVNNTKTETQTIKPESTSSSVKKDTASSKEPSKIVPIKIEKEEFESIQCRYLKSGFLFINHLGDVIPCCYFNPTHLIDAANNKLHGDNLRYMQNWKEFGGELATNLRYNEILDVIEGDWFRDIALSWKSDPYSMCLNKCKENNLHTFVHKDVV
jgi:MoaA/NifB/PqqE/SkfB family radical SAM enzyme